MMQPRAMHPAAVMRPAAHPVPPFSVGITPQARSTVAYVSGAARGGIATYADAWAWLAYRRGGWDTRNARRGDLTRYGRGFEDSRRRTA